MKRPIFHGVVLCHHLYVLKYSNEVDFSKSTDPQVLEMKTFALRYFTTWNMFIQIFYFSMALLHDIFRIAEMDGDLLKKIKVLMGYIFTSLMFPSTMFVFFVFWSVYSINREWVLPEASDEVIPMWLNHAMHTNIFLFLFIELFIVKQLLPSFKSAFIGFTILLIIYDIIFFFTYFESGRWLYGLFYVLNWYERITFSVLNYFVSLFVIKVGIIIQNYKSNLENNNDLKFE